MTIMRFEKVRGDLKTLDKIPSGQLGLTDILQVMQDVLLDTMDETGRELDGFPLSDEDAKIWISISKSISSLPVSQLTANSMSEKRKERLQKTKQLLEKSISDIGSAEKELSQIEAVERELTDKQDALRELLQQKKNMREKTAKAIKEVDALEAELAAIPVTDDATLERKKRDCEASMADRNARNAEMQEMEDEISRTSSEILLLQNNIVRLEEEKKTAEETLQTSRSSYQELQISVGELTQQQSELEESITRLNKQQKETEAAVHLAAEQLAQQQKAVQDADAKAQQQQKTLDELQQLQTEKQQKADALQIQAEEIRSTISRLEEEQLLTQRQIELNTSQIAQMREQNQDEKQQIDKLYQELQSLEQDKVQMDDSLSTLQQTISQAQQLLNETVAYAESGQCRRKLLLNYFGTWKNWHKWKLPAIFISILTGIGLLSFFLAVVWPGRQLSDEQLHSIYVCTIVVSVLMIFYCLLAMARVYLWIKEFQSDNFSNDEDFPLREAQKAIGIPPLQIVFIVAVVITDSQMLMAVVNILLGIFNIYHLLETLHPRYKILVEEEKGEEKEPVVCQQKEKTFMSDKAAASIMERILWLFEHEQLYLNPHLTVEDVASRCQFGRTYVSYVFKNSMGGFFNYVNKFRLQYADDYQLSHPTATQEEIAEVSGFSSRQSLYRVRQRLMWDKNTE